MFLSFCFLQSIVLGSQNITVNIRNTSPVLIEFTVGATVVWEITGIINLHNRLKLQCGNATKETYTVLQRVLFLAFLPRENIKSKFNDSGKSVVYAGIEMLVWLA